MTLRVIYLTDADGREHTFTFLVLDEGISFEFADAADVVPLFECASDAAGVN